MYDFALQFLSCVDSLWPQGLQHARLPWPSPSPWACSKSCPWSLWCHPIISSLSSPSPPAFPASGSFPVSWLFTSGGQSIGASSSASVLPVNIQGWFPIGLTGSILLSKGLSRVFSSTTVQRHQFFGSQPFLLSCSHILIAKFGLKLKHVGKATRPFSYDLNQIPYYYTVELTNRFMGLDLVDRVSEELWMEVCNIVQEVVIKMTPKKKKCKMVVCGSLTNSWEKKRRKGKGEKERYTHLNAEFQRIEGEIRKPS